MLNEQATYGRTRIVRPDGSFYNVVEVIAAGLDRVEFHKGIKETRKRKLADVAHLRGLKALARGISKPVIIVWDAYEHTNSFADFEPSKSTEEIVYVSRNALITSTLRQLLGSENYLIENGILRVKVIASDDDKLAQKILDTLYAEDRLLVKMLDPNLPIEEVYRIFDPYKDLVAVGQLGYPSSYAWSHNLPVVFNTSFFLFEEEDFRSDCSLYGDAYNLTITDGIIESPPLYERSALLFRADGQVEHKTIALQDLNITFLDKTWDLADHKTYTRYSSVLASDKSMQKTPSEVDMVHFVIIDRAVVAYKHGGGVNIPQNGFVLALPKAKIPEGPQKNVVSYSFKSGEHYRTGIQCGPGLIAGGEIILNEKTLAKEQFFRKRYVGEKLVDDGVVPTDYAKDIDETRAARAAIGIDSLGNFKILVVESVNQGMEEPYGESSGATLRELAEICQERGYKHALNLDGGGSATIVFQYGQLTKGADRRGLPGVSYERMVPGVGVILRKN